MLGLQLVVALGAAVVAGNLIARRVGLAVPVVLLVLGLGLSLIPSFQGIGIESEVVLLLFLPALLYWESLTTSSREIRRFIRGITLTGTLLVVVTAGAIATIGHALGLSWPTAWIIGAALAPTDATAVAALGRSLPLRTTTILRAESLINDGTALVVFALALELATGEADVTVGHAAALFAVSFIGGILVGLLTAILVMPIRRRITDPVLATSVAILTPFLTYLIAEEIHASGVLAVVVCGLYMADRAPRLISAPARIQGTPFWTQATFLLNGALFVLIGMELPEAIHGLSGNAIVTGLLLTAAVYGTMLTTRLLFLVASAHLIRAVDRRPQQRLLQTTFRARVLSTVAGFRGAVSLAVALAVPTTLPEGSGARDMIVFVTAGVVTTSLVVQGFLLPRVIAWAHLPADGAAQEEFDLANRTATRQVIDALPRLAEETAAGEEALGRLRHEYVDHLATWTAARSADEVNPSPGEVIRQYHDLKLAAIAHKRATVVRLRDERVIDDTVLRRIQARLDLEEVRLRGPLELD